MDMKVKELKIQAGEIITYMNEISGRNFRNTKTNVNLVVLILAEEVSPEDCKRVLAWKWNEWKNTNMERYFTPATIFNPVKFHSTLGLLPAPRLRPPKLTPPQIVEEKFDPELAVEQQKEIDRIIGRRRPKAE